jgi:hypothetical protein
VEAKKQVHEVVPREQALKGGSAVLFKRKFFLLFLFLLSDLILYPYAESSGSKYLLFRFFSSAVTILGVYAVSYRRTIILFALVLAIPTLAQRIVLPRVDASVFAIVATLITVAFDSFIVVIIFRRVFSEQEPNSEAVFGALCVYLLVGFGFSSIYSFVAAVQPGAFYVDPNLTGRHVLDRFDFIYYSFGTMTSLGAPGITPVSDQARSLSVIEAILGVLYLAVLISRLMGAYTKHSRK